SADKSTPESSKRPPRQPFTPAYISALKDQLDLSRPLDAAVYACLTTTFYCCARLGEFTVPARSAFKPDEHVKRSNVRADEDRHGNKVTVFFLPRTKTCVHGEEVFWATQEGPTDPEAALRNHFAVNQAPSDAHLFAYKLPSGQFVPLSRSDFLNRLQTAVDDAHLDPLQGHGIRIGSALEYLLRGLSFETVKQLGRWRSEAFTDYLRKHAKILAPYLQAVPLLHRAVQQLMSGRTA
ncbi:DNA breaking-rejoining enzyme, partial [Schizopora paradoxa]